MHSLVIACLYAFAVVSQSEASLKLPPFVRACKRDDPELSKCWRSSMVYLRSYLQKEIPKFYLPPLDEWSIDAKVDFIGETFQGVVRNVIYKGASSFELLDNYINLQENLITLKLLFPNISSAMRAEINGSILNYQFDSKGTTFTTTDNMVINYKLKGRRILTDKEEFLSFYNVNVDLQFETYAVTAVTYLETEELNESFTAEFANNLDTYEDIFIKIYLETIGVEILNRLKCIYYNYPLNVLHPVD